MSGPEAANRRYPAVKAERSTVRHFLGGGCEERELPAKPMQLLGESAQIETTTGIKLAGTVPAVAENETALLGGPINQSC